MIATWVYVVCAIVVVFSLGVFVGALVGSPGPWRRRGGMIDLAPGAARGELDLDWNFPSRQDEPERRPSFGV